MAGLFQRTHVQHVQGDLVSEASRLLDLDGLAVQQRGRPRYSHASAR